MALQLPSNLASALLARDSRPARGRMSRALASCLETETQGRELPAVTRAAPARAAEPVRETAPMREPEPA